MSRHWTAHQLLDLVLDSASFESWDLPVDISHHPADYQRELTEAATRAGTDEAVVTGRGMMHGRQVAVIANEFRFLGGSIGRSTAALISTAVRRATAEGLPILATTASGGTRMQEGTPAFVQMVEISRAVMAHRAAGLPYLVYLRHPTTGGVYASWGSLAHVTVAEPGALIGFLGPKVYQALNGVPFPEGVQTAENLAAKGVIDAVVPAEELPRLVDRALSVLVDQPTPGHLPRRTGRPGDHRRSAWASIELTRRPERAGVRDLLRYAGTDTLRLRGTDEGERDDTIVVALTRLDGQPCVLVGQDRTRQSPASPMGPAALREARRAMRLAEELRLPLVTVIDTPGAELSPHAEERAIAGEIARCIATLSTMTVPTVAVLLGQGCGGGALALLPAQTVIAAENAWLSPLPPEGASAIAYGDIDHAAAMAEAQHVRAVDLLAEGTAHHIVPERAGDTPEELARAVAAEIRHQLDRAAGAAPAVATTTPGAVRGSDHPTHRAPTHGTPARVGAQGLGGLPCDGSGG
jgi:acyl-CoA carboxylase subunit beta